MRSDLISVIVPSWNYGCFLEECLASLTGQTLQPAEIIIADDCSSDNTPQISIDFKHAQAQEGASVMLLRNAVRLGTIENENRAARRVRTPWFFYLDADDKLDATYIEKCEAVIKRSDENLFVVYSDMKKFGLWDGDWVCSDWDREALRQGNYINGHSVLRKDLFEKVGGLKDNGHFEDHWMWVEMMDLNPAFYGVHIPELLVWYRRHDRGHRTDHTDLPTRS